ncbi:DNA polymerase beta [Gammaproteobacteria bacterium]
MRLTPEQIQLIKSIVSRIIDAESEVWLFGSRVDDSACGGDIDLFIETTHIVSNRVSTLCRLEGALVIGLGDRKIDVLLKDARTVDAPIFHVAKRQGILL